MTTDMVKRRVLVIDDDQFVLRLLESTLTAGGFDICVTSAVPDFVEAMDSFDPHVVIVDLDLGAGPTGVAVLALVGRQAPWVGRVVMTTHRSFHLVDDADVDLSDVPYIVKGDLESAEQLVNAVEASLRGEAFTVNDSASAIHLTKGQAQVLRMIANGWSNERIAQERGISIRTVEQTLRRTYQALGLGAVEGENQRIAATRMFLRAEVTTDD